MSIVRFAPLRRIATVVAAPLLVAPLVVAAGASPATAVSASLVISQVYGGGGNSGATLKNDFVELFNRSSSAVDVTGWSVQYASSAGNTWQRTNLTGTIQPGQYYLVQEAAGAGGTVALPSPDATGSIAMSATSGKVALVTSTTLLTCGVSPGDCLPNAAIQDLVGYGTSATNFEGSPTANLSNTTAALRAGQGCVDTDNNASDFAVDSPNPRNTASPTHSCEGDLAPTVASTSPANDATNVPVVSDLTITFSEAVNLASGAIGLSCVDVGAVAVTVSGGPTAFTINPTTDFVYGEQCTLVIDASKVADQDSNDPPDTMAADYTWSFQTAGPPPPVLPIHDVQGAGHTSPYVNQLVENVQGLVTGLRTNGFWMQDTAPDANTATSEGIFVFTSSAPTVAVGDLVRVDGTVVEFRPGGATSTNLTTTELSNPGRVITVLSSGNPLPSTTVIGAGGRVPPTEVIEDDATGSVESSGVFDETTDGIDFYESLEGMRVQVNDAVVTGPRNQFGEIWVVADNGEDAGVRTTRGGVVIRANDYNPERIQVDDDRPGVTTPAVNVGATFTDAIVGVLDYAFGNFELLPDTSPVVATDTLQREVAADSATDELSVANFNVENLSPNDPQTKFDELAGLIVDNLKSPDLVILEEIQDNNGATDDSVVDATQTLDELVAAIETAGGPTYEFRQIDPADDQDGGQPGGNIRVGFMFRTDRGLSFVDRPGGDATTAVEVVDGADGPQLSLSPGRVSPTDSAWNTSRKPLAGEFLYNGHKLFVVGNHFNSKGGDNPLFGRFQPPTRSSEVQRNQQAQLVKDFVDDILGLDPDAKVIVGGDLNDFEFSDAVQRLTSDGELTALIETLPAGERYSYVFEGNSQTLDHMLASGPLADVADFDVVHVNAEFAKQASDHDPSVARFALSNAAPVIDSVTTGGHASCTQDSSVTVAFNDDSLGDQHTVTVDWGDGSTDTEVDPATSPVTVTHDYALAGSYPVTVTVDDGTSTDSATTTLVVDYTVVGGTYQLPIGSGTTARYGSTVVAKVIFEDCDGSRPADLAPTLTVTKGTFEKDGGTLEFANGEYSLGFKTKGLAGPGVYTFVVTVPETGQTVTADVRLR